MRGAGVHDPTIPPPAPVDVTEDAVEVALPPVLEEVTEVLEAVIPAPSPPVPPPKSTWTEHATASTNTPPRATDESNLCIARLLRRQEPLFR
jgi:hypothetical protein